MQKETKKRAVGYPLDVEEIYFGDKGILHHFRRRATVVDMTTSSPLLAEKQSPGTL